MTVQELIDILSDMNPDAEVKLAIQPSWPFQHGIDRVVEVVAPTDEAPQWGVVMNFENGDEEFEEYPNRWEADQHVSELGRKPGVSEAYTAAMYQGEVISRDDARQLEDDTERMVFIGEGGQECYLPGAVASELGW